MNTKLTVIIEIIMNLLVVNYLSCTFHDVRCDMTVEKCRFSTNESLLLIVLCSIYQKIFPRAVVAINKTANR